MTDNSESRREIAYLKAWVTEYEERIASAKKRLSQIISKTEEGNEICKPLNLQPAAGPWCPIETLPRNEGMTLFMLLGKDYTIELRRSGSFIDGEAERFYQAWTRVNVPGKEDGPCNSKINE